MNYPEYNGPENSERKASIPYKKRIITAGEIKAAEGLKKYLIEKGFDRAEKNE